MKKYLISALAISLFSCSNYHVQHVNGDAAAEKNEIGMYYFLPKKKYQITVTYEEIEIGQSIYYKTDPKAFAKALNKLQLPVNYYDKDETKYAIRSFKVDEIVVANTEQSYYISLHGKNNLFVSKKMSASFSNSGIITGTSSELQNNTVDYGFAAVNGMVKLASSALGISETGAAGLGVGGQVDKIDNVVDRIVEIRKECQALLGGAAEGKLYKEQNLNIVLTALKKEEMELLDLIKGSKSSEVKTKIFVIDPKEGVNEIFKFDSKNGFKNGEDVYTLTIRQEGSLKNIGSHMNVLSVKQKKKGVHYCVPATCEYEISDSKGTRYLNGHSQIPQLGHVSCLPNRVGAFKSVLNFKLDPETGALVSFEGNSEELDKKEIKGYIDEMAKYPGMLKKEEEKVDPYADRDKQIKDMEYEVKLLELQLQRDSLKGRMD